MDPINNLQYEHRLLEKSLFSIKEYLFSDIAILKLKDLDILISSLINMIDKIHLTKEDELLFPLIEKIGIRNNSAPLNILILQHKHIRLELNNIKQLNENRNYGALKDKISEMFEFIRAHGTLEFIVFFPLINNKLSNTQKMEISNQFEDFIITRIGAKNYENLISILIKTSGTLFKGEYPDNTQALKNIIKKISN